jgi:hypothetical protein
VTTTEADVVEAGTAPYAIAIGIFVAVIAEYTNVAAVPPTVTPLTVEAPEPKIERNITSK